MQSEQLKKLTYDIIGSAMTVYNTLKPGFVEYVYQDALEVEFKLRGIPYERECNMKVIYKGEALKHTYAADFVVNNQIIVECKALEGLIPENTSQLLNYMRASQIEKGILINFGCVQKLEHKTYGLHTDYIKS